MPSCMCAVPVGECRSGGSDTRIRLTCQHVNPPLPTTDIRPARSRSIYQWLTPIGYPQRVRVLALRVAARSSPADTQEITMIENTRRAGSSENAPGWRGGWSIRMRLYAGFGVLVLFGIGLAVFAVV